MSDSILKEEQIVLDIIQEYLNKNRTFNRTEIIPFISAKIAKSRSNISYYGIHEILKSLVEKNIIVEGSKLIKYEIFSNLNRKEIYEFIIKNPGCHFNKLVKTLNISVFSVDWHLNVLFKFNLVRKEKINGFEAFFDSKLPSEKDNVFHIISRDKCRKIIEYLKIHEEGCTKNHLSKELGMHYNTITKYINKLEKFGLLLEKNFPHKVIYLLNKEYYDNLITEPK